MKAVKSMIQPLAIIGVAALFACDIQFDAVGDTFFIICLILPIALSDAAAPHLLVIIFRKHSKPSSMTLQRTSFVAPLLNSFSTFAVTFLIHAFILEGCFIKVAGYTLIITIVNSCAEHQWYSENYKKIQHFVARSDKGENASTK